MLLSPIRTAVLTISDRCSRGERIDESGPLLEKTLAGWGLKTEERALLADDEDAIARRLAELADGGFELVPTTGGTGARSHPRAMPHPEPLRHAAGRRRVPHRGLEDPAARARGDRRDSGIACPRRSGCATRLDWTTPGVVREGGTECADQ